MTTIEQPSLVTGEKTIVRLSSTALSSANCILKFHRTVIDGYRGLPNYKAVYGVAVHKFIDTMFKTGNQIEAVMAAKKAFKVPKTDDGKAAHMLDERHMLAVCYFVWSTHIEEDKAFEILMLDGKPATEITFSIKQYEDENCIVLLEGTIDSIGQFVGGCFAIRDFKTTSYWQADKYLQAYELSKQLRFYRLVCKLMSEIEPTSILGKIGAQRMGTFIDAIFVKPNCNDSYIRRSPVYQYKDDEIEKFRVTVDDYILRIASAIRTGYLPKEGITNGTCDTKYGFCPFWNVCGVDDKVGEFLLGRDFKKVPFTPLDYNNVNTIEEI